MTNMHRITFFAIVLACCSAGTEGWKFDELANKHHVNEVEKDELDQQSEKFARKARLMAQLLPGKLEPQTEGRCDIPATKKECSSGPYPDSSYKFVSSGQWPSEPSGCYVYTSPSSKYYKNVYFNERGTPCQNEQTCLCNKRDEFCWSKKPHSYAPLRGSLLKSYDDKSLAECKQLCSQHSDCKAFEYFHNYGHDEKDYWKLDDCWLRSSAKLQRSFYNTDAYLFTCSKACWTKKPRTGISGGTIKKYYSKTLEQCQDLCSKNSLCKAIEYSQNSGANHNDCFLKSSAATTPSTSNDVYVFTCRQDPLVTEYMGSCDEPATIAECSSGPYPNPSYKFVSSGSWSGAPAGCYVYPSSSSSYYNQVFFNEKKSGVKSCNIGQHCLCKRKKKDLERQPKGSCDTPAKQEDCSGGPYPDRSYRFVSTGTWPEAPKGCYVYRFGKYKNNVYFNKGGTSCNYKQTCLCKTEYTD